MLGAMACDSQLRAWLALGAVLAVGVTAVAIRPAVRPTGAEGRRETAGETPSIAAAALATDATPLRPVAVAVLAVATPSDDAAAPAPARRRSAGGRRAPVPVETSAVATTPAIDRPVPQAPHDTTVADATAPDALPARALAAWAPAPEWLEGDPAPDLAPDAERGWAPRAGDAVAVGLRAGGRGIGTGFAAAGRALRRAF